MKGLLIRFAGAFLGVFLGEMSSLPFLPVFERAVGQRPQDESNVLLLPYFVVVALIFTVALELFRRIHPLTTSTGLRFGFVTGLLFSLTLSALFYTFTTYETLYILGVSETFLANYTLGGLIVGWLNERFMPEHSNARTA